MPPVTPGWFKQRQAKAEPSGNDLLRITGPNLRESFIGIRSVENGCWQGFLRFSAEGPEEAVSDPLPGQPTQAWEAAFELLRMKVVV